MDAEPDPVGHRLTGERTGMVYRLGDRVRIQVAAVNLDERKIDFVLAEKIEGPGKGQGRPGRKRGSGHLARKAHRNREAGGSDGKRPGRSGGDGGGRGKRRRTKN